MTENIPFNSWTLVHLAEHRDPSGVIERHLLGKLEEVKLEIECGQRHVVRLKNASELRVQCFIAACPSAQQGHLLTRHRRAHSRMVQVPLVPRERRSHHQQPQSGLPLPGVLVFSSPQGAKSQRRHQIHSASPDHASARFMLVTAASICSQGSDARQRWSQKNTSSSVNLGFRSPRKGSSTSMSRGLPKEGTPTEHPGACRSVVRGRGLVLHREMARTQRNPEGTGMNTTARRTAFAREDVTTWGLLSLGTTARSKTAPF